MFTLCSSHLKSLSSLRHRHTTTEGESRFDPFIRIGSRPSIMQPGPFSRVTNLVPSSSPFVGPIKSQSGFYWLTSPLSYYGCFYTPGEKSFPSARLVIQYPGR